MVRARSVTQVARDPRKAGSPPTPHPILCATRVGCPGHYFFKITSKPYPLPPPRSAGKGIELPFEMEHLDRDQLARLLRQAQAVRERDWVLLLLAFWHGLRASEALALTPANFEISPDGIFIDVQRLKGSLRTVQRLVRDEDPLFDEERAVRRWLGAQASRFDDWKERRLFPISRVQFYRLVQRYGAAAGLPKFLCHPHVLKHSIAMQSIRKAGIENVRQYLGHVSIASTGEYLKVDDAEASSAIVAATRRPT